MASMSIFKISQIVEENPAKLSYRTLSTILALIVLLQTFNQLDGSIICKKAGKFVDTSDESRYHQCIHLYRKLTYIHNKCPNSTCFSKKLNYCVKEACKGPPKQTIPYHCEGLNFPCTVPGLFAHPNDSSVYFQCKQNPKDINKLLVLCFTCNKKRMTCFSNKKQTCLPRDDGKYCNGSNVTIPRDPKENKWITNCSGYSEFPCAALGPGVHGLPGDNSVFWECTNKGGKLIGHCKTCSGNGTESCFSEAVGTCVDNCTTEEQLETLEKSYSCSSELEQSFSCSEQGLFGNPFDTSIFFYCSKLADNWDVYCFTCSSNPRTCFSQEYQTCISYSGGEECPKLGVIEKEVGEETTPSTSLTYSCSGYNGRSFPCEKFGEGKFETPADVSIFFTCTNDEDNNDNGWVAKCEACPKNSFSCYNGGEEKCVDYCDKINLPYECGLHGRNAFECKEVGYFAMTSNTAIYFGCRKDKRGNWESKCYSCNSLKKTCFDDGLQACVTNLGMLACATTADLSRNEMKGGRKDSMTYSCQGYSNTSFPCEYYSEGFYAMPGDGSVYVECRKPEVARGPQFSVFGSCHTCSKRDGTCYDEKLKKCSKNCGGAEEKLLKWKPTYNCTGKQFDCPEVGLFANPLDTSVYFRCIEEKKILRSVCFTCSSKRKTCFDENKKGCVTNGGRPCGNATSAPKNVGKVNESRTYDCEGYRISKELCSQLWDGMFVLPGDRSVYIICSDNGMGGYEVECKTCPKETRSCFIEKEQRCVENCGRHNPYDCSWYDERTYPCRREGYFSHPKESSVYFKCLWNGVSWHSLCFTCNSKRRTCFSEAQQACLPTNGKHCGNASHANLTRFIYAQAIPKGYTCEGYGEGSFPCSRLGPGTYANPGDNSVYFHCLEEDGGGGGMTSQCETCSKETKSCFVEGDNECVENCGRGPDHKPYNCSTYTEESYPCLENGLFVNSNDSSIYFQCIHRKDQWKSVCFPCNGNSRTCFKDPKQGCVPCDEDSSPSETGNDGNNEFHSYDCTGYNILPETCSLLGSSGLFPMPGDKSVYIECQNKGDGEFEVECQACSKQTKSCFMEEEGRCVENCGKATPYDCTWYDEKSYPCSKEGYFPHPKESSVYFGCLRVGQEWLALCFTCNGDSEHQTCFSELLQKCLPGGNGTHCGSASNTNIDETISSSSTFGYTCVGYNELSYPCSKVGLGTFANPGDKSVYFDCVAEDEDGRMISNCTTCPKATQSCFIDEQNKCIENCGKGPDHKPYHCETYNDQSYPCNKEGLFVNPDDASIYFKCISNQTDGQWKSICFTCNQNTKTCFDEQKSGCVTNNGGNPCGNTTSSLKNGKKVNNNLSREYDCTGYNTLPKICSALGPGTFVMPGDKSLYITCSSTSHEVECQACPKHTQSCFIEEEEKCVENCGTPAQYDCSFYDENSYPCVEEGYFPHPKESSVYFKCIRSMSGGNWEALCYTCSNQSHSCFSEAQQECIPTSDDKKKYCGSAANTNITTNANSTFTRTHSCEGYNELSFPCSKLGSGIYANPGDKSVYFHCIEENGKMKAKCETCPGETKSCFVQKENKCVENCGKGPDHLPYDCGTYNDSSYPCSKEGVFANPKDSSVYFKCILRDGQWKSVCFSCNVQSQTCFRQDKQSCVSNDGGTDCGSGGNFSNSSAVHEWSCDGYSLDNNSLCERLGTVGTFYALPGDRSVYFSCLEDENRRMKLKCEACSNSTQSCYVEDKMKCVENCGRGPDHRPYDCETYSDQSYPCVKEGIFGNPDDTSIYFQCVKNKNGSWKSICFSCNSDTKTCFNEEKNGCVLRNGGKPCGNSSEPLYGGNVTESRAYDCAGYKVTPKTCSDLGGTGLFPMPGDKSVYINCLSKREGRFEVECKACSKLTRSCFMEEERRCVENCGRYEPYDCTWYDHKSYLCSKEGYFPHPRESSVYFGCLRVGQEWLALCFSCNSKYRTCFSEAHHKCIPGGNNNGTGCGSTKINTTLNVIDGNFSASSLTYSCEGYNELSYPCSKVGLGTFANPGDKSVYFDCVKEDGKITGNCKTCPEGSCFMDEQNKCIENFGRGPAHEPYHCGTYDDNSYPCSKEGLFANPGDKSVYFKCISNQNGKWKSVCFPCNSQSKTCFNEKKKGCVLNGGQPCGSTPAHDNDNGANVSAARAYDCSGYTILPSTCSQLGNGQFVVPGDRSLYIICKDDDDGKFQVECKTCPKHSSSCFFNREQKCLENCGKPTPYDCTWYDDKSYHCSKKGYFAHPKESSVYFKCVRKRKKWHALCHTCSKESHACFSDLHQACLPTTEKKCGNASSISKNVNASIASLSYSCRGYNELSFPCSKVGPGEYANPGDKSVYFHCVKHKGKTVPKCKACPKQSKSCYIEGQKKCIENCGRGPDHKPYDCGNKSYPCSKEGLFGIPNDTSIYFQCIPSRNGDWKSVCFTCSNGQAATCFSESEKSCITNGGHECGNVNDLALGIGGKTTTESGLTYDCSGYNILRSTCSQLGAGTFPLPGDKSVYIICKKNKKGGGFQAECKSCPKHTKSCFIKEEQKCVENCGNHIPYDCTWYDEHSYPCSKEGYFPHPKESSVYFKCVRKGQGWAALCHTCSSGSHTCFSETQQACLPTSDKQCGNPTTTNYTTPVIGNSSTSALTHSCAGYNDLSFPCSKLGPGTFPNPGDKSVYFHCTEDEMGNPKLECQSCPEATASCYIERKKQCIENCGKGPTPKPYSCDTYKNDSYPCTKDGLFPNPDDSTVFFKCFRKHKKWISICFSCSGTKSDDKPCFDGEKQICVTNCGLGSPSNEWDCSGYSRSPYACDALGIGRYPMPGDPSIYLDCLKDKENNDLIKGECSPCPKSNKSCFMEREQQCILNCGDGPAHQPYDCSTYTETHYPCTQPGIFVNPKDASIYFKCVRKDGQWRSVCFSCSNKTKSCFSEEKETCVSNRDGSPCGPTNAKIDGGAPSYEWGCSAYSKSPFACEILGKGKYPIPGDPSVFFECKPKVSRWQEKCSTCPRNASKCFNEHRKGCSDRCELVRNSGFYYNCSQFDSKSYPCAEIGFFPHPEDSSMYFQCVKVNDKWESYCFACDRQVKTCFSRSLQRCLPLDDFQPCGTRDPAEVIIKAVDKDYRGYRCDGYGPISRSNQVFPCGEYGQGVFLLPGDRTVYIKCDSRLWAFCHVCDEGKKACFDQNNGSCVDNCWPSLPLPLKEQYDCGKSLREFPKCSTNGVFPHPKDTSVYYRCAKRRNRFTKLCYSCSPHAKTCFNPDRRICMKTSHEREGCRGLGNTIFIGDEEAGRSYSCDGFRSECKAGAVSEPYTTPGDSSIYMQCSKGTNGKMVRSCLACNKNTCFDHSQGKCVEDCVAPADLRVSCRTAAGWNANCLYVGIKQT